MTMTVEPVAAGFAAQICGIDLRTTLAEAAIQQIAAALDRHAVVVFRDQPLSQEEQIAFCRRFGPLDLGLKRIYQPAGATERAPRPGARIRHDALIDISNLDAAGSVVALDSKKIVANMANQLWHSDSSFQNPPARYSMLSAVCVPATGGDTQFADMRAAYDALDAATQAEIKGLEAEHFALHSRVLLGDDDYTPEQIAAYPPVSWPIIRTHPGSGRKLLFIGAHTTRILGMPIAVGRMLLQDLLEHAVDARFVYTHEWRAGDLVVWDNRATLHRGRRYDLSQRRELRRTTTLDIDKADGGVGVQTRTT